jgi:hypothetical protein
MGREKQKRKNEWNLQLLIRGEINCTRDALIASLRVVGLIA